MNELFNGYVAKGLHSIFRARLRAEQRKIFQKITGGQEQTDATPEYPEAAPDASNDGFPLVEDHVLMFYG